RSDQITDRKAHVPLERLDAGLLQPVADRRNVRGHGRLDARDRLAGEGSPVARHGRRRAERLRAGGIGGAHVEVRPLAVVADEEQSAAFERAVDVDHGHAAPLRVGDDAIRGLEDETAQLHAVIMRVRSGRRASGVVFDAARFAPARVGRSVDAAQFDGGAGRALRDIGVLGTAANPSMDAAGAPSMARTLPKTPISRNALLRGAVRSSRAVAGALGLGARGALLDGAAALLEGDAE